MTVNTQTVPTPPAADTVITLTSATQSAFEQAINAAKVGEITRIVLPKGAEIDFNSGFSTKNITGKTVIIDFNGARIDLNTNTGLSFEGSHEWVKSVSSLSEVNGNAVISFAGGLPNDLAVGDWVKIVSEDTAPGGRTDSRRMGEAMQVTKIDGNSVTFDGALSAQELYKTEIRAAKYDDGSVWLIDPEIKGDLSYQKSQISFNTMVDSVIISPDLSTSGRPLVTLKDTVNTVVTDPQLADGVRIQNPWSFTYGINSISSKNNTVYSTGEHKVNVTTIVDAVDSGFISPSSKSDIENYGPDHDLTVVGLTVVDNISVGLSTHAGAWGATFEDVHIDDAGRGIAVSVRGRGNTYKNLTVENVDHAFQFYNEGNEINEDGRLDSYNIDVIGGSYKVSDVAFFTSGQSGNNLVDEIHFYDTYFESSGSGWFAFIDHAKGHWTFSGDTIKLTGSVSTLFKITGSGSNIEINDMTLDLSDYSGSSVTLFDVSSGSNVSADDMLIINPHNVKIIESSGGGSVDVVYGTPDAVPYEPDPEPDPAPAEQPQEDTPPPTETVDNTTGDADQADADAPIVITMGGQTAAQFNGHDQLVEVAHDQAFMLNEGTVTLAFRANDLDGMQGLISKDSFGYDTGGHFSLRLDGGRLVYRMQSTGQSYYLESAAIVTANSWHTVTMNWGAAGLVLYLDGAQVATNAYAGGLGTSSGGAGNFAPLVLGAATGMADDLTSQGADMFFHGEIADVSIYDQAMTPSEVTAAQVAAAETTEPETQTPQPAEPEATEPEATDQQTADTETPAPATDDTGATEVQIIRIGDAAPTHFDGNGQFAEIAHRESFMLDEGTLSIDFKADDLNGTQGLISKDSFGYDTGGHFVVKLDGDQLKFRLQSVDQSFYLVSEPGAISAGTWHTATVNWGSDGLALYLDGALVATNSYTGGLGSSSGGEGNFAPWVVGASTELAEDTTSEGAHRFFQGDIADVRIYDQQLSPAETQSENVDTEIAAQDKTAPSLDDGEAPLALLIDGQASASFDGNGQFAEITHSDSFMLDEGTMSFSFTADDLNGAQGLISKDSFGYDTGGHFMVKLVDGQLVFRMQSIDQSYYLQSATDAVSVDTLHQVTVSWGAGGLTLHLDGNLVASDDYSGGMATTSGGAGNIAPLVIGASTGLAEDFSSDGANQFFNGEIADLLLYDRQLSLAEIVESQSEDPVTGNAEQNPVVAEGDPDGDGVYVYTSADGHHVITDFDNFSGDPDDTDTGLHQSVDLKAVFDGLGGVYVDGSDDQLDRSDAILLTQGNFDDDADSDDVTLTIDGVDGFSITFLDPALPWPEVFGIGDGADDQDDIWV